jgi:uncharacterized protein YegL
MVGEYLGEYNGDSRRVCRLLKYPDWIYKEYRTEVSPDSVKQLDRLIRLPEQMKRADKALVDAHTSWPVARVVNMRQATIGVLTPLAPDTFRTAWQLPSGRIRDGWLAVDVLALTEDRQIQVKLAPQSLYNRISICTSIATIGALLESSDLAYLDWSYANVFWSMLNHSAYVIDLDGCSFGPRPQIESPNWADPLVPRGLNAGNESDRYRVALLVARCLTGIRSDDKEVREALDGLRRQGETISRVARLLMKTLNASSLTERPSISDLSVALEAANEVCASRNPTAEEARSIAVTTKVTCLPVYVVIDTSLSMKPFEDVLNESIETLYDELITSPRISDFAHISILSYNTDAEVVLHMTDLQSLEALPQFECGGVSNFSKAIDLVRQLIDEDVPRLRSAGREVLRPIVFLLTGSQPTNEHGDSNDSWKRGYALLVDNSYPFHPNVVPFGYGSASSDIINEISTIPGAAFLATANGTGEALQRIIPTLLNTIVASARNDELRLPTEVEGFIRVSEEIIDSMHVSESVLEHRSNKFAKSSIAMSARDQVFISYSHADRKWLRELQTHLMPYLRSTMMTVWDDSQITAGEVWGESIEKALASAKVAVLLVSPAFLASRFIAESELPPLLEAARSEGVTILWVPVRFSSFDRTPIAAYQATHSPEKPLASLSAAARDKVLVRICEMIQQAYQR